MSRMSNVSNVPSRRMLVQSGNPPRGRRISNSMPSDDPKHTFDSQRVQTVGRGGLVLSDPFVTSNLRVIRTIFGVRAFPVCGTQKANGSETYATSTY